MHPALLPPDAGLGRAWRAAMSANPPLGKRRSRRHFLGLVLVCTSLWASSAQAACRQALALGLDISGSVDGREYRLQLDGLAAAITAPAIRKALLALTDQPVAIAIYEWSGQHHQILIQDWRLIRAASDLDAVAITLRNHTRTAAPEETALGAALIFGASLLASAPACARQTLDISGDGQNNIGPPPQSETVAQALSRVTVNALVIGSDNAGGEDMRQVDIAELSAYFRRNVIRGPGSFIQVAIGYEDYEDAMARKLLRETRPMIIGHATSGPQVRLPSK